MKTTFCSKVRIPNDNIMLELEGLTGKECYDKYGLKEDETITITTHFADDNIADLKCVIPSEDSTVWYEIVLFNSNGYQLAFSDVEDTILGEWELANSKGSIYKIDVVRAVEIGDKVWVGETDDTELDEWLEEQNSREIKVGSIEGEYLWGESANTNMHCPYHIEIRDLQLPY